MSTRTPAPAHIDALRERMIAQLRGLGAIRTEPVETAIRTVGRHLFMPEETPEKAYAAEYALVTKRDENGVSLSSVSAARIQAFMLEQADIRPGMRVLEIGSGGYNAALIAALVGESGEVTTIDIDADVVERARKLLAAAGYDRVHAVVVDGAGGEPAHAPYDRIVVTVEAADLASAWVDQLAEGGRIVVPMRLRGLTWSVAFHREGDELVARDFEACGFVPMRGAGASDEQLVVLHDGEGEEVGLRLDEGRVDAEQMRKALAGPRVEAWSGVTLGLGLPYDDLELWLVSAVPEFALLAAAREARDRGVVASWSRRGVATLLDRGSDSFAYLAMRPTTPERKVFEFGAVGHGPEAARAADHLIGQIRVWDRDHRGHTPELQAFPVGTHDRPLPAGAVLERSAFRFTISWPAGR
jgi:protein-L-isoaspartate(D-aspartate) O-methyltransferase